MRPGFQRCSRVGVELRRIRQADGRSRAWYHRRKRGVGCQGIAVPDSLSAGGSSASWAFLTCRDRQQWETSAVCETTPRLEYGIPSWVGVGIDPVDRHPEAGLGYEKRLEIGDWGREEVAEILDKSAKYKTCAETNRTCAERNRQVTPLIRLKQHP